MADYNQIVQLIYRWCAAHDAHDLGAMSTLITEDAEMFGQTGRESILTELRATYAGMTQLRRHVLTNTLILENGPDEALSQSYILHYLVKDDTVRLHYTGIYRFLSVLQNGQWRLRKHEDLPDITYRAGDAADRPSVGILRSTRTF